MQALSWTERGIGREWGVCHPAVGSRQSEGWQPLGSEASCATLHSQEHLSFSLSARGVSHVHWQGAAAYLVTESDTAESRKEKEMWVTLPVDWAPAATCDHACLLLGDSGCSAGPAPPPCAFPDQPDITALPPPSQSPNGGGGGGTHGLFSPGSCSLLLCECQGLPNSTSHPSPDAQAETESWDRQSHVSYGRGGRPAGQAGRGGFCFSASSS